MQSAHFIKCGAKSLHSSDLAYWRPFAKGECVNSEISKFMSDLVMAFEVFAKNAAPIINHVVQFHKNSAAIASFIPALEQRSWFVSFSIPTSYFPGLVAAAEEGGEARVATEIESIYRQEISEMATELSLLFPARSSQILPAYQAHARHEYALSVPMFLIAAAGICRDALQTDLFAQNHFTKKLNEILKQQKIEEARRTEYESAILGVFERTVKLATSAKPDDPHLHFEVNRHLVLHGSALPDRYGTEVNSLKAFSFLATVTSVLSIVRRMEHN